LARALDGAFFRYFVLRLCVRLIAALMLTIACVPAEESASDAPLDSIEIHGDDTVNVTSRGDWRLLRARQDARTTYPEFVARLQHPPADQQDLALKARFAEPDPKGEPGDSLVEHLWLVPLRYADGRVLGVVDNEPTDLRGVQLGDSVWVDSTDVSDWMAVERDTLVAGFTVRVFRARMVAKERSRYDSINGYVVLPDSLELRRRRLTGR
jgi:uncharacterized protein YegJ (DUF2314 family)